MRGGWILIASAFVIGVAFLLDRVLAEAIREGARTFQTFNAFAWVGIARFAVVAVLIGLGWLVMRGPRSRPVGAAMLVIGLYLGLAQIYPTLLSDTGISAFPLTIEALEGGDMAIWASATVAILGLVNLLWPSPTVAPAAPDEAVPSQHEESAPA